MPPRPRNSSELTVSRQVAARLAAARKQAGLTLRGLAQALTGTGVPIGWKTIHALEAGADPARHARAVTVDELVALAAVLGTTPGALLHGPGCAACCDTPPPGFTCNACGAGRTTTTKDPA